jgi:hypothetical protein
LTQGRRKINICRIDRPEENAMAWKQLSVAKRSASIAAGISLGTLFGQLAGQCLSAHGVCTVDNSSAFIACAVTFFCAWAAISVVMGALERHRRNHPGHEA